MSVGPRPLGTLDATCQPVGGVPVSVPVAAAPQPFPHMWEMLGMGGRGGGVRSLNWSSYL